MKKITCIAGNNGLYNLIIRYSVGVDIEIHKFMPGVNCKFDILV